MVGGAGVPGCSHLFMGLGAAGASGHPLGFLAGVDLFAYGGLIFEVVGDRDLGTSVGDVVEEFLRVAVLLGLAPVHDTVAVDIVEVKGRTWGKRERRGGGGKAITPSMST